jgi:hypothetical protein
VSRVGRFLLIDAGMSAQDRGMLHKRCGFLEFADYSPSAQLVRSTADGSCYVLPDAVASRPAMFDTARPDQAGGVDRAAAAGLRIANLDEVLSVKAT